jgi:hypothetical protein
MLETTVEAIFGVKAGMVWEALNENGPSTVAELTNTTSFSREDVFGARGWLGREDKISIEICGRRYESLLTADLRSFLGSSQCVSIRSYPDPPAATPGPPHAWISSL